MTNTILLYEKGFLIVEGESEEIYIPAAYKKLYGRTMDEDGIVLINLFGKGSWKSATCMLLRYRIGITRFIIDTDDGLENDSNLNTKTIEAVAKILGISYDTVMKKISFVGVNHFEDTFSDKIICRVLCRHFPRLDGEQWTDLHIQKIRQSSEKFVNDLFISITLAIPRRLKPTIKKTEFAKLLAEDCTGRDDIPQELVLALSLLRQQIGIEESDIFLTESEIISNA